jgi:hypothetical protein
MEQVMAAKAAMALTSVIRAAYQMPTLTSDTAAMATVGTTPVPTPMAVSITMAR